MGAALRVHSFAELEMKETLAFALMSRGLKTQRDQQMVHNTAKFKRQCLGQHVSTGVA